MCGFHLCALSLTHPYIPSCTFTYHKCHNYYTCTHAHTHTHSNGQAVEGAEHQSVVQLIRQSGKEVTLVVITVTDEEARRLEPDNSGVSAMDYFERRSVPVSVPDTKKLTDELGKEYVGFNVYLANKFLITRRYREFDSLNSNVSGILLLAAAGSMCIYLY